MIGKIQQVVVNETIQTAPTVANPPPQLGTGGPGYNIGGPLTSTAYFTDALALYVLIIRVTGTVTGTTPTLAVEIDQSNDLVTWVRVGGAPTNITAAGVQVVPYATGTTQGAITQTWWRVVATPGGTLGFFPGVYIDVVAQAV
jgi:hypothetical protein